MDGVLPAPDDWRETPDGSILFYDEIQKRDIYAGSSSSVSKSEIIKGLETHRHTGHDIFFITQFPTLLHLHVRALVGQHYHLHRGWGMPSATVYMWAYTVVDPNQKSKKNIAEQEFRFNYPKSIYKYYKSATVHTHKIRIPRKMIMIAGIVCMLAYFVLSRIFSPDESFFSRFYGKQDQSQSVQPQQVQTTQDLQQTDSAAPASPQIDPVLHELQRVAHVIEHGTECYAKNSYGELLDIPLEKCRLYSSRPSMLSGSRIPSQSQEWRSEMDSQSISTL
ncbi:MAG: zonular occludens toxin domain-containing protein [Pseudomonadota bacterium]|nr:zonular occludens toxin domain-containing protein [Pseudomonadota bacterium]